MKWLCCDEMRRFCDLSVAFGKGSLELWLLTMAAAIWASPPCE